MKSDTILNTNTLHVTFFLYTFSLADFWILISSEICFLFETLCSYLELWIFLHILGCRCCCSVASVVSDSVRPHRWQPTRLPRPWDSPGKNTGVGCHFLLQCMKVKSEREVAQSCLTLLDPMGYSLPGSSIHGIFQARLLEWGAIALTSMKCQQLFFWNILETNKIVV